MTKFDYDLFVIGAGSGGVRAARIAATHGAKVAVAEEYRVGGTCVIRGCIPKKLLVYASRFPDEFEDAASFGWTLSQPRFDWPRLIAAKDREIARLEGLYKANLNRAGVEIIATRAVLDGPNTISLLAEGRSVTADKILIATGGRPSIAGDGHRPIPGAEHVITSNEAFHLSSLPRRVLINGGGYIALEFAGIFNGLGSETAVVYRRNKILRGFDEDMRDGLTEAYTQRAIRILSDRTFVRIDKIADGLRAHFSDGSVEDADVIMFATGRRPNVEGLGLESAGVQLGSNGGILIDENYRSTMHNIYAVGDVSNEIQLTPVAIREGHAFADSVFGPEPWSGAADLVPTAVFSTPEIGTVGVTEAQARDPAETARVSPALAGLGGEIDIYKSRFRPLKATLGEREERMIMKLIVDRGTDRVMGCHVLGADAAEIVQMAAVAMRMGATKADFDATVALHPSAAEELVTMRTKWTPA